MAEEEPQQNAGDEVITDLDRLRSFLDCSRETMDTYIDVLEEDSSFSELLHALSLSSEFSTITVRDGETQELAELRKHAVAFIREGTDVPSAKVNVLLQAFILELKPDPELSQDPLKLDMALVEKTAGELVRAIFEICLYKGWARLADKSLTLCKMVERRIWHSMTWLRQFRVEAAELGATEEDFKKIDDLDIKWFSYYCWSPAEIEKHLKMPGKGEAIQTAVCQVPGVELSAPHVRPVSRTWLQVKLTIKAASHFTTWNDNVHGDSQAFWVVATTSDQDSGREVVLHREYFQLEKKYWKEEHVLNFPVLLSEPPHGQYTIRAVSDEWLALETRRTVRVSDLFKPAESPQPTVLHLDLEPVPVSDVMVGVRKDEEYGYKALYKDVTHFNPIQTQVFESLYNSDDNVFVGAPMGSGKSVCAEFAILRLLKNNSSGRCVYVAPNQAKVDQMYKEWSPVFGQQFDQYLFMDVFKLTGETGDKDLFQKPKGLVMIVATPEQLYTVLPRREQCMWNAYARVNLFIMDDLHLIGRESRSLLEIVCSRMCFISDQVSWSIRMVALSNPVANPEDLCKWLDVHDNRQFNFPISARPVPLITKIQGYCQRDAPTRLGTMAAPVRSAVKSHLASGGPVLVFVPSWRQSLLTAQDLVKHGCTETVEGRPDRFLLCSPEDIAQQTALITDKTLREMVGSGVGFLHGGLPSVDRRVVEDLFAKRAIRVLVVSQSLIWSTICQAHLVIIMDTQHFDGQQHRHTEYQVADVLQMVGLAEGSSSEDKCILMCQNSRKDFYKKVLSEPLPVESHLDGYMHSFLNAEIVSGTIRDKTEAVDCLNRTFLSHRMTQNPSYYNLQREFNDDMFKNDLTDPINDLVDKTLENLVANKMCTRVFEDHAKRCLVGRTRLGSEASSSNIDYETIVRFVKSLLENQTTLTSDYMIGMMSRAKEFDDLPIRFGEESVLDDLKKRMKFVLPAHYKSTDPHVKTNLLLQAHIYSIPLSLEVSKSEPLLLADTGYIVEQVPKLLLVFEEIIFSDNLQLAGARAVRTQSLRAVPWNKVFRDNQWYQDLNLRKR